MPEGPQDTSPGPADARDVHAAATVPRPVATSAQQIAEVFDLARLRVARVVDGSSVAAPGQLVQAGPPAAAIEHVSSAVPAAGAASQDPAVGARGPGPAFVPPAATAEAWLVAAGRAFDERAERLDRRAADLDRVAAGLVERSAALSALTACLLAEAGSQRARPPRGVRGWLASRRRAGRGVAAADPGDGRAPRA